MAKVTVHAPNQATHLIVHGAVKLQFTQAFSRATFVFDVIGNAIG